VGRRLGLRFDVLRECPLRVGCGLGGRGGTPFLISAIFLLISPSETLGREKSDEGTHD